MKLEVLSLIFIIWLILVLVLKLYLNYRQAKSIKNNIDKVPFNFTSNITLEEHQKAARYSLAKLKLNNLHIIFSSIVLFGFTLGGGIQLINDFLLGLTSIPLNNLTFGVAVIISFTVINSILELPFNLYATFNIEQKFGFNNTTIKLFIIDQIKATLLAAIIGIPLIYLVLWLVQITGSNWWIWVWAVLMVLNLLLLVLYPTFIAPLFNKFTPLADGELKQRIRVLFKKTGFKARGEFVMDGSKRSSHGNAYFTGIGKAKSIVFFDTLLKNLNVDEIEAVLAHELGHFKKKHILKQILISFALTFIGLFISSILIKLPIFYQALGVNSMYNYNGLLIFMLLIGLITFPLAPIFSFLARKNEFEADNFTKQYTKKEDLISGLVKLYKNNASTLTPDNLYVKFYYSHPPASVRIAKLEEQD